MLLLKLRTVEGLTPRPVSWEPMPMASRNLHVLRLLRLDGRKAELALYAWRVRCSAQVSGGLERPDIPKGEIHPVGGESGGTHHGETGR